MASRTYEPLFVGGAPRTGTTLLHSLICTSPDANDYVGECSYLSALIKTWLTGARLYDVHTSYYFDSRAAFKAYHAALVTRVMNDFYERFGRPSLLVLKDPLLTANFGAVAVLVPDARFVVTVRDPRDSVVSRIRVFRKQHGDDAHIHDTTLLSFCQEFNESYQSILERPDVFEPDRLLLIGYEQLTEKQGLDKLEAFGIKGIDAERPWGDRVQTADPTNPWFSPLYNQTISAASVGQWKSELSDSQASTVVEQCGPVVERLGFPVAG